MRPFEGRRLRQHPVPQIEPEAWHPQIADEPWESQIERASVPSPVFAPRQNQPDPRQRLGLQIELLQPPLAAASRGLLC